MIFVWTVFLILMMFVVMSIFVLVTEYARGDSGEGSKYFLAACLFIILAAIPASFIW